MKRLRTAFVSGAVTFATLSASFGAYAFLAPAIYQTNALVGLVVPPEAADLSLGPHAAERLHQAVLEGKTLQAPAALEVQTSDGRTFAFSYRDSSAARATDFNNQLALRAVLVLPTLVPSLPEPKTDSLARAGRENRKDDEDATRQHTERLAAFLRDHPEVMAKPEARPRVRHEGSDPEIQGLEAERAKLQRRLSNSPNQAPLPSENPYSDPASVDPEVPAIRRRIAEIQEAIQARRAALLREARSVPRGPSAELKAEWQALKDAVSRAKAEAEAEAEAESAAVSLPIQAPAPKPTARLIAKAQLPTSPLEPNRSRLLMIGLGLGVCFGALAGVLRAKIGAREQTFEDDSVKPGEEFTWDDDSVGTGDNSTWDDPVFSESEGANGGDEIEPMPIANSSDEMPQREVSGIEPTDSASNLPPGRVTRTLGSPIPPAPREPFARSATPNPVFAPQQPFARSATPNPRPAHRSTPAPSNTGYSYVSTLPPAAPNISEPNASSAVAPISEARRISSHPPASVPPPSSKVIVAPHPVSSGWRPRESLAPESRRQLCSELYPLAVQQCFVVAVSGVRGSGAEIGQVAAELSLALAETGHPRILLLEGNLERPSVHRMMQLEMPLFGGFSEQLEARIQGSSKQAPWSVLACSPSLHVLAEGVMRIPELILSRQFEDCVQQLREYYDVIVVAGPVVSEVAACRAVQDVVDGVVLVCPKGGTSEIAEASALFSQKRFSTVLATG